MNKQCSLMVAGKFAVYEKKYKIRSQRKNGPFGHLPSLYGLHMPQMCVKVDNKSSFVDQTITLTTHINKGKQYPYASRRQENKRAFRTDVDLWRMQGPSEAYSLDN